MRAREEGRGKCHEVHIGARAGPLPQLTNLPIPVGEGDLESTLHCNTYTKGASNVHTGTQHALGHAAITA